MKSEQIGPLNCVVIDGGPDPSRLVVLCHGFGAPGQDLVPIGDFLLQGLGQSAQQYRFIFPEAPIDLTSEGMPGGRAWWSLNMQRLMALFEANDFSELRTEVPPGIDEARDKIVDTIESARNSMPRCESLVIGGFSQGAMLTLDATLRGLSTPPDGLIQFSGTLICEPLWQQHRDRLQSVRVMQSHGTSDFVLPYSAALWLREFLEGSSEFEFISFDGPHAIPMESLQGAIELLSQLHQ